ncbi:phospholipid/cholesterol/gamma-HCH transport system substrate-binding protein [Nocardia tenerifensis]|uniref:Phospholipid/cholesterol/gamma-HCH transport system substrate-binding protein n=1 Tax=Nocardia tenerifensis TaxID=228006 RepID=A0A318JTU1_9NOCA|nr:MlaD family protein [Nocardia tenerifensis]PXX58455.1 phospholipid/cholesterol/gamma-HCH transport system substrate-binding protein [Nocardia tenerifensis]
MTARALLLRLGAFAAVMIVLLIVVLQVIERPVEGETDSYTAEFTDANGLKAGDDVRVYGVRVGKVGNIRLTGSLASVQFSVGREHKVFDNSTLAIRYQNLSGERYLDIQQPDQAGNRRAPGRVIGVDHTVPAFDITTVFNGLEPVLAQLTPADLNQFATSMLAVIEGSGTGMGPALDAIEKLSGYVTDRQTVITTLVRNLGLISEHLGGKSGNAVQLLTQLTAIFVNLTQKVGGLIEFSQKIPPVLIPAENLLATVGFTPGTNPDLENLLRVAFPDPNETVATLSRLPVVLQQLSAAIPSPVPGLQPACSNGNAQAPQPLQLLIAGQRIALCKN